jgi:hypothetical protein
VAPPLKLSDQDVRRIRRRVDAGEQLTALAQEFGVDRKTIRRRLDALAAAEDERTERVAMKRLRAHAVRGTRRLLAGNPTLVSSESAESQGGDFGATRAYPRNFFEEWLETPKNLSGRAAAEARGLVRVSSPDGSRRVWRERSEVEALFREGWALAE